jgi:hypothetical protein
VCYMAHPQQYGVLHGSSTTIWCATWLIHNNMVSYMAHPQQYGVL